MQATDVLDDHHRTILDLVDGFPRLGRGNRSRRRELFDQLQRAVRQHLGLEEEMLYPAMFRRPLPDAGRRLDRVLQEHLFLGDQLRILGDLGTEHRRFPFLLAAFRRRLKAHQALEHKGPYREIRGVLKKESLERLGSLIGARIELLRRAAQRAA